MTDSSRKRRPKSISSLLGDVIDDTKGLVDDVLDRTADLERDASRGARRVVRETKDTTEDEFDSLKSALDDLTAKVNRLANLQAKSGKSSR